LAIIFPFSPKKRVVVVKKCEESKPPENRVYHGIPGELGSTRQEPRLKIND